MIKIFHTEPGRTDRLEQDGAGNWFLNDVQLPTRTAEAILRIINLCKQFPDGNGGRYRRLILE